MISDDFLVFENAMLQMHVAKIQANTKERAAESISCFLNFSIRFINKFDLSCAYKMGSERWNAYDFLWILVKLG